jgi:cell wall-associated NlpC family hydrolase
VRGLTLLFTSLMLSLVAPVAAHAQTEAGSTEPPPSQPPAQTQDPNAPATGGAEYGADPAAPPRVYVPGVQAALMEDGFAAAPADAPVEVQEAVFAANEIVGKPYAYGGGHRSFKSEGYDCSGTVSYALNGGGLLKRPLDSSSFMRWGEKGKGAWITVYTNPGHAYAVIAGLRLDTSAAGESVNSGKGPRWRSTARKLRGYRARHPLGF